MTVLPARLPTRSATAFPAEIIAHAGLALFIGSRSASATSRSVGGTRHRRLIPDCIGVGDEIRLEIFPISSAAASQGRLSDGEQLDEMVATASIKRRSYWRSVARSRCKWLRHASFDATAAKAA